MISPQQIESLRKELESQKQKKAVAEAQMQILEQQLQSEFGITPEEVDAKITALEAEFRTLTQALAAKSQEFTEFAARAGIAIT